MGTGGSEGADDRAALSAARDGDDAAARTLLARHGPSMVRAARSTLGRWSGEEAEDVVQEALVAALSTAHLPVGDVGAWLRAVTVRKALDGLRRYGRRREQPLPEEGIGVPAAGTGSRGRAGAPRSAGGLATGTEASRVDALAVREALATLSPTDRAVLVLADVEGRSMAEVAGVLGSTAVAVRLRASRARRKLARLLEDNG